MSKNEKSTSLYRLVVCAFLVALSIVCGKFLQIPVGDILRFSLENLPILLAGLAFGPVYGALVGVTADLLGSLLRGYAIIPLVTVGACLVGLVAGLCSLMLRRLPDGWRIGLSVAVAHLIGSVAVKTIGLAQVFSMPYPVLFGWRLLNYAVIGGLEAALLIFLLTHPALRRLLPQRKGDSQ